MIRNNVKNRNNKEHKSKKNLFPSLDRKPGNKADPIIKRML